MCLRATVVKPIDSPKLLEPSSDKPPVSGCSLRAAYEGWDKMELGQSRPEWSSRAGLTAS